VARDSALDLGVFNITVNCIAPGPFITEMPMAIHLGNSPIAFAMSRRSMKKVAGPRRT
jgi:NAD(P)-dependent dehydrogenase (short-subunit alcohol dehydrogenase family)